MEEYIYNRYAVYLKEHYGQYHIVFSDHTIGISAPIVAVGMGAEINPLHS